MNNLYIRKSKITVGDLKKMIENLPNDYVLKYYKRYEFDSFNEYRDEMNDYENVTDIEIEMLNNSCSLNIE